MNETLLQAIKEQATAAWIEAWQAKVPHTQHSDYHAACLKWYW